MPTKLFIYPYKQASKSCKLLAKELQAKIIKLKNSKYKPKPNHIVINWGNSNPPNYVSINKETKDASNKLRTFERLQEAGIPIPEWTTDINVAKQWLPNTIFARKTLNGHSGAGIVEFTGTEIAPLYVKYIKKRHEYRIHVGSDDIIDIQQKKKKVGVDHNSKIRNLANGWIYAKENIDQPQEIALVIAKSTIKVMGLTFGAVDMIYNEMQDKYYVLEVNTAPGLEGSTVTNYANFLKHLT